MPHYKTQSIQAEIVAVIVLGVIEGETVMEHPLIQAVEGLKLVGARDDVFAIHGDVGTDLYGLLACEVRR